MSKKNNILVTTTTFGKYSNKHVNEIRKRNYNLILNPFERKLNENELDNLLDQYNPIGLIAGTEKIGKSTLHKAKKYLRVISRMGSGWDNVNRVCASNYGIKVFRTKGILNSSVAELTLGLILNSLRRITENNNSVKNGVWKKSEGNLLSEKTIGIIGFGEIGQTVGKLSKAFECNVIYCDIRSYPVKWAKKVSKIELLKNAEIISLHANCDEEILGHKEFDILNNKIRIIINTARGHLINEMALFSYLKNNHKSYACLDVYQEEPYKGNLCELNNTITTPHIGSYAIESRNKMEQLAVSSLLSHL